MTIAEEMQSQLIAGRNIFLTGSAGTGKTFALKSLSELSSTPVALTATTGVAALNLSGSTLHRFLGIGIQTDARYVDCLKSSSHWGKIRDQIRESSPIVIDECSMLRSDVLELVDAVLKAATGSQQVFGGKRVVFAGDFLQLPPVVKSHENLTHPWAFQHPIWTTADFSVFNLKEVHRQEDVEFISALQQLRMGRCDPIVDKIMADRENASLATTMAPIRFFPTNAQVDSFNIMRLDELNAPIKRFAATTWGATEDLKQQIIRNCMASEELYLKEGAQVMVLRNDADCLRFINGSMGTVKKFTSDGWPVVMIEKTGEEIAFELHTWQRKDVSDNILAEFCQIPLKLAYATTIHKSQGLTLDFVEVDCAGMFATGQAYVALSRIRGLSGLRLLNWDRRRVAANKDALRFYENDCKSA